MNNLDPAFFPAIYSLGAMGGLLLLQLLLADFVGIARRHPPGTPIPPDHRDFHFRVSRALANSNESVAIFVLLLLFCLLVGAAATWVNISCWIYVAGRIGHMVFYYAGIGIARSIVFAVSLLGLAGLLLSGMLAIS